MFFTFLLFCQAVGTNAVCFIAQDETVPRQALAIYKSDSFASCKLDCIRNSQCTSIAYNATLKLCVYHGSPVDDICPAVPRYTRLVKTTSNCPQPAPAEIISNFVPDDPCLKSARFSPAYTVTDRDGICPINVVDGEATARNYFVSIIRHDGTYDLYDNNAANRLQWDATLNSWVVYLYWNARLAINDPVYAVTCAYYPTEVAPECPCADLPLEPPGTGKPSVAPAPICPGQLRARKWIMYSPPAANGDQNSWIVSSASCL
ncbi:hypothetical protein PRIPAC_88813 [Pristionchus pacificus]|uniref:Apple domain-containing protein n=1 Tax=Pristionchus pacificus TaxID=54126 RepID=A0A2A6B6P2_PRIPA|nr:hypothetical protein PRIPAC_88813 [Pristionchus pacificus]|eukprot:PDM61550.1 hypothetical protein PRIPAC_50992 [Pristionchus pacificus]